MTRELSFIPEDLHGELEEHPDVLEALQPGSYYKARCLLIERGFSAEFVQQLEAAIGEHLRAARIAR